MIKYRKKRKQPAVAEPLELGPELPFLDVILEAATRQRRITLTAKSGDTEFVVLVDRGGPVNVTGTGLSGVDALTAAAALRSGTYTMTMGWPVDQPHFQLGLDDAMKRLTGKLDPAEESAARALPAARGLHAIPEADPSVAPATEAEPRVAGPAAPTFEFKPVEAPHVGVPDLPSMPAPPPVAATAPAPEPPRVPGDDEDEEEDAPPAAEPARPSFMPVTDIADGAGKATATASPVPTAFPPVPVATPAPAKPVEIPPAPPAAMTPPEPPDAPPPPAEPAPEPPAAELGALAAQPDPASPPAPNVDLSPGIPEAAASDVWAAWHDAFGDVATPSSYARPSEFRMGLDPGAAPAGPDVIVPGPKGTSAAQGKVKHWTTQGMLWIAQVDDPDQYDLGQAAQFLRHTAAETWRSSTEPVRRLAYSVTHRARSQAQRVQDDWRRSGEIAARERNRAKRRAEQEADPAAAGRDQDPRFIGPREY